MLAQFATAEQQKTDLDAQLKPLVQEQDDLRARLNDFEARKNAIGVRFYPLAIGLTLVLCVCTGKGPGRGAEAHGGASFRQSLQG